MILRIRLMRATELDHLRFKLNGEELPAHILRKINHIYQMSAPRFRSHSSYWFVFKLDGDHWPVRGENSLEVTLNHKDLVALPEVILRDVELEIKYLMGKNYHRSFVDPDLGPFEGAVT